MPKLYILIMVILCLIVMTRDSSALAPTVDVDLMTVMEEQKIFDMLNVAQDRVNNYGGSLTENEMRMLFKVTGWSDEEARIALQIAYCESHWSPFAVGDGGASVGFMQLNYATWYPYAGYDGARYSDIVVHSLVAKKVFEYDMRVYGKPVQWSCWR